MDIAKGKVLVTGAGGFIGSHLVEGLLAQGCQVRAFVRYNSRNDFGNLELLGGRLREIEVLTGDLRDYAAVRRAVDGCRLVLHLGALIGIPYSYVCPRDVFAVNLGGTLNVLDAARECGTEKMVVTSTSEVFGTPLYVPIDEKHPLQAQSPYAASKIASDKAAESYVLSFDLPVAVLRPFNTYGPRQSARAVIPTIAAQAMVNRRVRLGSLQPRRDLLYVSDTVAGFIAAARCDAAVGKAVNIGTGGEVSVGELAELILQVLGLEAPIEADSARMRPAHSEVMRLQCNPRLAESLLGWEAKVGLEEGLTRTVSWIRENIGAYKAELYNV